MDERDEGIQRTKGPQGTARHLLDLTVDIDGYVFLTSFLVYLVFQLMEILKKGSVIYFINPDTVLYVCAATGAIYILANRYGSDPQLKYASISLRRVLPAAAAAAILAGLLTYRLMSEYGIYAVLIAVTAGILTGVTCYMVFTPAE